MPGIKKVFGNPQNISGQVFAGDSTLVPLAMLQNMRSSAPIPVVVSGSNNETFTINTTSDNRAMVWVGLDVMAIDESLFYTWTAGLNPILDANGVQTNTSASTLGIWYYYVGIVNGALTILPSQTPPSAHHGNYPNGSFSHPGADRTTAWSYVGYHMCTNAGTPAFRPTEKIGFRYIFQAVQKGTTGLWALLGYTGADALPDIGHLGGTTGGYIAVNSNDEVAVGSTNVVAYNTYSAGQAAVPANEYPFSVLPIAVGGNIYGAHAGTGGNVNITHIDDVV